MSKRRVVSVLVTGRKKSLKYPVKIVAALSGTGTVAEYGVFTYSTASGVAAMSGKVYLTVSSGTNIGTVVGTGR